MPALPILSKTNRSFRKFKENYPISEEYARKFIDYARTAASSRNLQPLKYHIVIDAEEREKIFPLLSWAGYISDWDGPEEGQRPTGYIIMCNDTTICPNTTNALIDAGIAAEAITLGAREMTYGGCMLTAFSKKSLKEAFSIPEHLDPIMIIALGKPTEDVRLAEVIDGDIKYYRDEKEIHYVPKRSLEEILF